MSDKELLAQIAQIAGAINKHIQTPVANGYQGYNPSIRGGFSTRGSRGGGRGGYAPAGVFNRSLTLNNNSHSAPPVTNAPPAGAYNRSLTLNNNIPPATKAANPYIPRPSVPTVSRLMSGQVTPPTTILAPTTTRHIKTTAPYPTPRPTMAVTSKPQTPTRHLTLVNKNDTNTPSPVAASPTTSLSSTNTSGSNTPVVSPKSASPAPQQQQWIQSKTKNMSLMNESTFKKTMVAKQKSIQSARETKAKLAQLRAKRASDRRKGIVTVGGTEYQKSLNGRTLVMRRSKPAESVVINGVEFEMDRRGNKLIRRAIAGAISKQDQSATIKPGTPVQASAQPAVGAVGSTPKQFSMGGVDFVRTTNGNLVRATLVKDQILKKQKAKAALHKSRVPRVVSYCKYFTKTGQCPLAGCYRVHSRDHLAICKKFLRGICRYSASTCLLSHKPNPHTTPPCYHFQRAACSKVDCPYPHIRINPQAPICRPFATQGWCDAGNACKDRHVWLCPDFGTERGCKGRCGLAHVENGGVRAKKTPEELEKARQEWQAAVAAGTAGVDGKKIFPAAGVPQGSSGSRYWEKAEEASTTSTNGRQFDENFIPLNFDENIDEDENSVIQLQGDSPGEEEEEMEGDISSDGVESGEEMDYESGDEEGEEEDSDDVDVDHQGRPENIVLSEDEEMDHDLAQRELDDYYAAQDREEYE
ncbi:hypothetical protein BGZ83_000495 [Gryganskiella cystojenkinii]|nr:hypothetical protein BGZ83_000495 [Gryganskiella cystojenkinii]